MNHELANPKTPNPQLTDAQLDAALGAEHDGILPSSGFADAVMFAVQAEAPAPIPFPWRRAIPGMIAAAGALGLLVARGEKDAERELMAVVRHRRTPYPPEPQAA